MGGTVVLEEGEGNLLVVRHGEETERGWVDGGGDGGAAVTEVVSAEVRGGIVFDGEVVDVVWLASFGAAGVWGVAKGIR